MMALFYGLLPKIVTLGIPVFLHGYLDLFAGAIQTYVFCMLSMVFINDNLRPTEGGPEKLMYKEEIL